MNKDELKQLIKLQMKQADELLDKNVESGCWSNDRATLFQVLKSIRKNSIEFEKKAYKY
ncbi:hypothetical protein [Companilactobacillus insicii]|uniref:hypothetical protein n=1 Tax=Companilactobacillus insicii TaxID=1732567 RepID=UPI0013DE14C9|nr:hypothetical protein [Companilactobacillus insicii]